MSGREECCTPAPPAEHLSSGKEEKCCGFDIYFNWPTGFTKAVVFTSDIFGWDRPLLRKFADKVAAAGFVAVVPDLFKGDPLFDLASFNTWIQNHPVDLAAEDTSTIIKCLKEKGITSVGLAGFCYGAKVGVLLAKEGQLDATVLLHPSIVSLDDVKAVKGPLAVLAAEHDTITPLSLVEKFTEYLESQTEVEHFVKIFPGVAHGWSVRYDEKDEKAVKLADEAQSDAISFFKKYL